MKSGYSTLIRRELIWQDVDFLLVGWGGGGGGSGHDDFYAGFESSKKQCQYMVKRVGMGLKTVGFRE